MTNAKDLRAALAAAGLEAPVRWDDETASTNATALELAEAGTPEWTLVSAGHQTAGRGRLGRTWEDRPGRALMFSLVLRPGETLAPGRGGLVSLLAGAAMAESASEAAGTAVRCRWPNDLLVGEGKVGGILAESSIGEDALRYVVIGIGANLEAPEGIDGAAGLGPGVDPTELLAAFLVRFRDGYRPRDDEFGDVVRARWLAVAATIGRVVEATTTGGHAVRGTAVDLDAGGGLIVETADGLATVAFGEVVHLT